MQRSFPAKKPAIWWTVTLLTSRKPRLMLSNHRLEYMMTTLSWSSTSRTHHFQSIISRSASVSVKKTEVSRAVPQTRSQEPVLKNSAPTGSLAPKSQHILLRLRTLIRHSICGTPVMIPTKSLTSTTAWPSTSWKWPLRRPLLASNSSIEKLRTQISGAKCQTIASRLATPWASSLLHSQRRARSPGNGMRAGQWALHSFLHQWLPPLLPWLHAQWPSDRELILLHRRFTWHLFFSVTYKEKKSTDILVNLTLLTTFSVT